MKCPFKKKTVILRDADGKKSGTEIIFGNCDRENCMAYYIGWPDNVCRLMTK